VGRLKASPNRESTRKELGGTEKKNQQLTVLMVCIKPAEQRKRTN